MRSIIRSAAGVAGALLLSAATAHATPMTMMKATVPFPFVVKGQVFPAGTYTVERDDNASSILMIRGDRRSQPAMFVSTTPDSGPDPAGSQPALQFRQYENQYRLTRIWESTHEGWDIAHPER